MQYRIKISFLLFTLFLILGDALGQSESIEEVEKEIQLRLDELSELNSKLEGLKIELYSKELKKEALPSVEEGEELIEHSLFSLVYDEESEQAKWVAHVIAPEIINGNISRSNDFRVDPKVKSGTAIEQDYFLKTELANGEFEYDGFGYDRGHLAPSADFRWSEKALSESYYYSNMSPQLPGFNREVWAELENELRSYLYRHPESRLYVVTGPVFLKDKRILERSVNKLAIPDAFFKVAYDPFLQKSIAFLLPHQEELLAIENYALSIDSLETITGIDFYAALDDNLESSIESSIAREDFIPALETGDVLPIPAPTLPKNHFNTVQAKIYVDSGDQVCVCGTVVSTKKTRNGHVFLNLDKRFPNQIFTVTIWKDDLINFSYDPSVALEGKKMCFTGKVSDFDGTPSMNLDREKAVKVFSE
jgi:endonuclease G